MEVLVLDLQDRPIDAEFVRRVAHCAAQVAHHTYTTVSIALVDDKCIAELNRMHLGRKGPTDVLAYPSDEDDPEYMGDVVVSTDMAARQAAEADRPLLHEVAWLAAHGVLHLLGYDDANQSERAKMLALQDKVLTEVLAEGSTQCREEA